MVRACNRFFYIAVHLINCKIMKRIIFLVLPAIIMSGMVTRKAAAQQESGWRGPGRTGIYNETGLLKSWPSSGPSLLWEAEGIGPGHSSATITSDAIYLTGVKGENDVLTAFTQDGKKKWEIAYGRKSQAQNYPESRCTPTFAYGKIFVVSGMVLLGNYIYSSTHDNNSFGRWICVDWTTGKTMWAKNWNNKGSVISADGMLIIYEERNGNIALVKPDPEKLDIRSEFRVTKGAGPYWSHPVVDKGRLFLRHGDYMAVYSIK